MADGLGWVALAAVGLLGILTLVARSLTRSTPREISRISPEEIDSALGRAGSLVEKREVWAHFNLQRVRWPAHVQEVMNVTDHTAMFHGTEGGRFFAELGHRDVRRLERLHAGAEVVVERVVSIDEWGNMTLQRALFRDPGEDT